MLTAKYITKKFGEKITLDNISIEIKPGTITSIIGPSGSGKTTLLRTLALLEFADTGQIEIDGTQYFFPLENIDGKEPWPKISVVFQQLFIWPHLTLRKNIELPLELRDHLEKNKKYLEELYDMFRMRDFIDRFPNEVSLGQRQRTALVRALATSPDYLLLDEITSSLDVEQSEIILSHLATVKKNGVGIIMVAHDINFALSNADAVYFLEEGRIVKKGKPYEFLLEKDNERIANFINDASLGASNVKIYSGKEEFQAYHLALLKRLPENSSITVIGGLGNRWYEPMADKYKQYDTIRIKKNITWNMLMYEYGEEDKRLAQKSPSINNLYTLSAKVNMANININSDGTVLLQSFDPIPKIIEIKDQSLADSYMHYYNDLVKNSKKFS